MLPYTLLNPIYERSAIESNFYRDSRPLQDLITWLGQIWLIGTKESSLGQELRAEGFQSEDWMGIHLLRGMCKMKIALILGLILVLHGNASGKDRNSLTDMAWAFQSDVCLHDGPLATHQDECKYIDLPLDASSPTGYRIPTSVADAFQMLGKVIDAPWKERLRVLYEKGYVAECARQPECVSNVVGELVGQLEKAWGEKTCNALAKDLQRHGIAFRQDTIYNLIYAYRDSVVAPGTDGPFTRFVNGIHAKPSLDQVYPYLISRGFALDADINEAPCQ